MTAPLTGLEAFAGAPVQFIEDVLCRELTIEQRRQALEIATGKRTRIGHVIYPEMNKEEATFISSIMLWRAATQGRGTLLWGGTGRRNANWLALTSGLLNECRRDVRDITGAETQHVYSETDNPHEESLLVGIMLPNRIWAGLSVDPFLENLQKVHAAGVMADLLVTDHDWMDASDLKTAYAMIEAQGGIIGLPMPRYAESAK